MAVQRAGDRLLIDGPLDIEHARSVLRDAAAACGDGVRIVDLSGVSVVDSAAVALALELERAAAAAGRKLAFANLPQAMQELARLYAVAEMIPTERV
jgi:phospholipid transport system transporter-binding protein